MKPVSVRFKCFGPYLHEQLVDFTQLEQNGLFLICGETGCGKTTILDAMCYALYGKSSGGLRGDISVMRCKQAGAQDETFVEYIFDDAGKRYRFFRSLKPRKKRKNADGETKAAPVDYNTTCECQIFENGLFVPMPDTKDKATYVNEKAHEIIGLTYDQFRQVIILPQGQFEQLLVSNSEEKEKILVTLFHAEKWQKISSRLFELADAERRALDTEKVRMDEILLRYGCDSPAQLAVCAGASAERAAVLKKQLEQAEKALKSRQEKKEQAVLENRDFEQCGLFRQRCEKLRPGTDYFKKEEALLALSDEADTIEPVHRDTAAAYKKQTESEAEHKTARSILQDAVKVQAEVRAQEAAHNAQKAQYEADRSRAVLLNNAAALYDSLDEKRAAEKKAEKELSGAEAAQKSADCVLMREKQGWENAVLAQRDAIARQQAAQKLYLAGIGSVLAEKLQDGVPCPVCGSVHHPAPALPADGHISDAQLAAYDEAMEAANHAERTAHSRFDQADAAARRAALQLSECRQAAAVAKTACEQALASRIDGIEDRAALKKAAAQLAARISQYEKAELEIRQKVTASESAVQAADAGLRRAQTALQAACDAFTAQKAEWDRVLAEHHFPDGRAFRAALIPAQEKQRRKTELIRFRTDLTQAETDLAKMQEALAGRSAPDVEAAEKQLAEIRKARNDISEAFILEDKKRRETQADADALQKRTAAYSEKRVQNEEALMFAKRLRGDFGISLQRYVLGVMLTSITSAANRLLKTVYGGRYQLYRTNEASGSARKRGLELEVSDQDGRRSVTTLSGGEKFLLSLSLAIGLSAVVQAQGSGVHLDAMFIDEGFGSLDSKSIDDALEVLQSVRRSSGLVGIISHVDRLAETIPAKIQITKTKNGSECRIII